jgi:hypothetical protein
VTISAPLASSAAAFWAKSLYLPVPTISRERNVRPATVQVSSSPLPPPTKWTISSTSPSASPSSPSVERGTIVPLRSTATFSGLRPSSWTRAAMVAAEVRRGSPLTVRFRGADMTRAR